MRVLANIAEYVTEYKRLTEKLKGEEDPLKRRRILTSRGKIGREIEEYDKNRGTHYGREAGTPGGR